MPNPDAPAPTPMVTLPRDGPCCAHSRVSYYEEPGRDRGTVSGYWACDLGCGMRFVPAAALKTAEAERDEARREAKLLKHYGDEAEYAHIRRTEAEAALAAARERVAVLERALRGLRVLAFHRSTCPAHLPGVIDGCNCGFDAADDAAMNALLNLDSAGRPATEPPPLTREQIETALANGAKDARVLGKQIASTFAPPERDIRLDAASPATASPTPGHLIKRGDPACDAKGATFPLAGGGGVRVSATPRCIFQPGHGGPHSWDAATPEEPPRATSAKEGASPRPLRAELKCLFADCKNPHTRIVVDPEEGNIAVCDSCAARVPVRPAPVIADTAAPTPEHPLIRCPACGGGAIDVAESYGLRTGSVEATCGAGHSFLFMRREVPGEGYSTSASTFGRSQEGGKTK